MLSSDPCRTINCHSKAHHLDKKLWKNPTPLDSWTGTLWNSLPRSTTPSQTGGAYSESGEPSIPLPSSRLELPGCPWGFFVLAKRPPHPLALLRACKCRDSWRYGWVKERKETEWDKEILVQKKMLDSRIDRSNLSSSHCFILHFSLGTQLSPPQNCVVLFGVHINGFLWHYKGRNRPIMRHTIQLRVYLKYWCTNHLFDTITEELVMFCSFENIGKGNPTTFQHFLQVVLSIIHSYSTKYFQKGLIRL